MDINDVLSFIDSIATRDTLNIVERAVTRTRMQIGAAEREAREADPAWQAEQAASRERYEREAAAETERWNAREAARRERIAAAPILGTFKIERIRPRYLVGQTIDVIGVNDSTFRVNFPDEPAFRTWAGRSGCRIPKTAGTFTPGATR